MADIDDDHIDEVFARVHDKMTLWVVYDSPTDCPGKYVARMFVVAGGESRATAYVLHGPTLDAVRGLLPPGLYRLPRHDDDEPHIVETWL